MTSLLWYALNYSAHDPVPMLPSTSWHIPNYGAMTFQLVFREQHDSFPYSPYCRPAQYGRGLPTRAAADSSRTTSTDPGCDCLAFCQAWIIEMPQPSATTCRVPQDIRVRPRGDCRCLHMSVLKGPIRSASTGRFVVLTLHQSSAVAQDRSDTVALIAATYIDTYILMASLSDLVTKHLP